MERQSGSPVGSGRQAFKGSPAKIETAEEYVSPAKGKDTAKKDLSLYVQGGLVRFAGKDFFAVPDLFCYFFGQAKK
jgi:hypothetical protein